MSRSLPRLAPAATDAALQRLWAALHGADPFPGVPAEAWKAMGFQGASPLTDVRGAGAYGLDLLVRTVEGCSRLRPAALASDAEYPFCAAALDVAFMVFAALKLLPHPPAFCPALGTAISAPDAAEREDLQGFAALAAAGSPDAVLLAAVQATMTAVETAWGGLKATLSSGAGVPGAPAGAPAGDASMAILHFKHVLQGARAALLAALAERPPTVAQLAAGVDKHIAASAGPGELTPLPSQGAAR